MGKVSPSIKKKKTRTTPLKLRAADWRFGPAKLWYDMLGVPADGEGFDYGFKHSRFIRPPKNECYSANNVNVPDESFLMVAQATWEDDIIWDDDEETRQKVLKNIDQRTKIAGWLPSRTCHMAPILSKSNEETSTPFDNPILDYADEAVLQCSSKNNGSGTDSTVWYSAFNIENQDLIHQTWEDEIIWDSEAVSQIPKPKLPTYYPEDIILIPDDDNSLRQQETDATKSQSRNKAEGGKLASVSKPVDPFNISNDCYYFPAASFKLRIVDGTIVHSTPVLELRPPFIPNRVKPFYFRNFHRLPLKRYSHGALTHPGLHPVTSLAENIKEKAEQRKRDGNVIGSCSLLQGAEDLTGRDGELLLIEFCEQHPPLMNQVGMCSKIKNYCQKKEEPNELHSRFRYGETAYCDEASFFGVPAPKELLQVIENNMYRAPIYRHKIPETDFLIIRTRHQYFIREFDALFVAGQQCPFYEVPAPYSAKARSFATSFMQAFIYRLFWSSADSPKQIKMSEIMKAFPAVSRNHIYKLLHSCANFARTGWWILKPGFRLPPEEEIRAMVSPEQCCAYLSMMAAQQRLEHAGIYETRLSHSEDEDENYHQKKDVEIKAAPWNTTVAFIRALKGECLLDVTGPADPTGCGEGFSFTPLSKLPPVKCKKEKQKVQFKTARIIPKFNINQVSPKSARILLHKFGIPKGKINQLNQWEVFATLRILSKRKSKFIKKLKAKFGENTCSRVQNPKKKFRDEWQRIFDLEKRVLSSDEVLLTDNECYSDDSDADFEDMGKRIECMLMTKELKMQLFRQQEERRRMELHRIYYKDRKFSDSFLDERRDRVLKIYRTFRDSKGEVYTRVELVRDPTIIRQYIKTKKRRSKEMNENRNETPLNIKPAVEEIATSSKIVPKPVVEEMKDFVIVDGTKIMIKGKFLKFEGKTKLCAPLEKRDNMVVALSLSEYEKQSQKTDENQEEIPLTNTQPVLIIPKIVIDDVNNFAIVNGTKVKLRKVPTQPRVVIPKLIIDDVNNFAIVNGTKVKLKKHNNEMKARCLPLEKFENMVAALSVSQTEKQSNETNENRKGIVLNSQPAVEKLVAKPVTEDAKNVVTVNGTKIVIRGNFRKYNKKMNRSYPVPKKLENSADLTQPSNNVISKQVVEDVEHSAFADEMKIVIDLQLKELEIALNPVSEEILTNISLPDSDSVLQKQKKTDSDEISNEFSKINLQQLLTDDLLYSSEDDDFKGANGYP